MSTRLRCRLSLLLVLGALVAAPVGSHEGEDHGAPTPVASDPDLVVRFAANDDYEVVVKYRSVGGQKSTAVRVYVSDFATNTPIDRAQVTLRTTTPRKTVATATPVSTGTYEAMLPSEPAGRYTLIVAIEVSSAAEFAFQDLPMGEDLVTGRSEAPAAGRWPPAWLTGAALLLALTIVALLVRYRSHRSVSRSGLMLMVVAAGLLLGRWAPAEQKDQTSDQRAARRGPSQTRYVPKESQFFLGVRTVVARQEPLHARLSGTGHVVPESGAVASVEAPRDGKLESAGRRLAVGDRVREGELIANLLVIDRLPIRAPISGLVAEVHFASGQWVQAGDPLVVILDERRLRVELPLFGESLSSALRTRDAIVTSNALPGKEFPARVRGLAPTSSEPAGGVRNEPLAGSPIPPLLLTVTNRGGLLRPGMLVDVSLKLPGVEDLIAVPESAVIHQESGSIVFIHAAPEVFEQRAVRIVGRYGTRVGLTGEIHPGDRIVVLGAQGLVSAPPVTVSSSSAPVEGER